MRVDVGQGAGTLCLAGVFRSEVVWPSCLVLVRCPCWPFDRQRCKLFLVKGRAVVQGLQRGSGWWSKWWRAVGSVLPTKSVGKG